MDSGRSVGEIGGGRYYRGVNVAERSKKMSRLSMNDWIVAVLMLVAMLLAVLSVGVFVREVYECFRF